MATAELKRKPRLSKIECYKAANIKKCSFASSFVSLLMGTYPAAAARRSGRTCRLHYVKISLVTSDELLARSAQFRLRRIRIAIRILN